MYKKVLMLSLLIIVSGCAGKNGFFSRAGDRLDPSTCTKCKGEPFYVDGRWVSYGK